MLRTACIFTLLFQLSSAGFASVITGGGGSSTPGGSTNQVQYNNGSTFAGSTNFQFNGTSVTVNGNFGFSGTSTHGVVGSTTNDSAASGNVGEYIESVVSGVTDSASGTWFDVTSISLTAGDWDVTWLAFGNPGTTLTDYELGISVTSGNSATGLVSGSNKLIFDSPTGGVINSGSIPSYRMSLSTTTTVYGKTFAGFGSTVVYAARLSARRMR